ncbi:MAG: hypothetical protein GY719_02265 [bacterium]|nr:hypothetical protein [bacterium]
MRAALTSEDLHAARAYHLRREAERRDARERRRQERLAAARRAIRELAPGEPTLRAVYLFGSILQTGRFGERSDVDVAVDSDDPAAESRFWQALEASLDAPVDVRPRSGAVAAAVEHGGERVYAREDTRP